MQLYQRIINRIRLQQCYKILSNKIDLLIIITTSSHLNLRLIIRNLITTLAIIIIINSKPSFLTLDLHLIHQKLILILSWNKINLHFKVKLNNPHNLLPINQEIRVIERDIQMTIKVDILERDMIEEDRLIIKIVCNNNLIRQAIEERGDQEVIQGKQKMILQV